MKRLNGLAFPHVSVKAVVAALDASVAVVVARLPSATIRGSIRDNTGRCYPGWRVCR